MSKPRNKTKRRRLHYLATLAAAGLLTVDSVAPAMAQGYVTYDDQNNIIGANSVPSVTGAQINGGTGVTWNADEVPEIVSLYFAGTNTVTVNGGSGTLGDILLRASPATLQLNSYSVKITGNIEVSDSKASLTISDTSGLNGGVLDTGDNTTISGSVTLAGNASVSGAAIISSAAITIDEYATGSWNTTGNVGVDNENFITITNNSATATASFGVIKGTVTATRATFAGMEGGALTVDTAAGVEGHVTGEGNTITANNNNGTDAVTIAATIGEPDEITELTFSGAFQSVDLTSASLNIDGDSELTLGAESGAVTDYTTMTDEANVDTGDLTLWADGLGSILTFGNVAGNAEVEVAATNAGIVILGSINAAAATVNASASGSGSQSVIGDITSDGDDAITVTNTASDGGEAITGNVSGSASLDAGVTGSGGGSSTVGDVNTTGTVNNNAEADNSVTVTGDVSGGTVNANATGDNSSSTVGNVSGGTVNADASGAGSSVVVGNITGEDTQVESTVSNGSNGEYGVVSNGGTLVVVVDGEGSTAGIKTDDDGNSVDGGNVTAEVTGGGYLEMGNIVNDSVVNITASSDEGGPSSIVVVNDIIDSTVNADAGAGGAITITSSTGSTINSTGNVTIAGNTLNIRVAIRAGDATWLEGSITGTGNNIYSVNDGGNPPEDYSAILTATSVIGSYDAEEPVETIITFGQAGDEYSGGAVTVTDEAGSQIRATNNPNGTTTVNFVNGTEADLSNTTINGGTVAINVDDESSLSGIGNVYALANNPVNLTIDNQGTTGATNAGDLRGLGGDSADYSSLTIANGDFAAGDISGNWNLKNADGFTQTYDSIGTDTTRDTNFNLGDSGENTANAEVAGNIGNSVTTVAINVNAGSSLNQTAGDTLGTVNINVDERGYGSIYNLGDSTDNSPTALTVAGELGVSGTVNTATVTGSDESGAAPGVVSLAQALGDSADLTIGDSDAAKALVTVNVENVTGGSVTVNNGGAFNQTGEITGDFILANNTGNDNQVALGTLVSGTLNYGGNGDSSASLAQISGNSTVANTNTGSGRLNVGAAAADSNTIYSGPGTTAVAQTGANATSTAQGTGDLIFTGILGENNSLVINDGALTFGDTFEPEAAGNITSLAMDSTNGQSTLTNSTGVSLTLGSGLEAIVGNSDVVVNSGEGLTLGGDVAINGTGEGSFTVAGSGIDLDGKDLNLTGGVDFNFGDGATGFTNVNGVNTADGTMVSFKEGNGYLVAETLNVDGATVYDSNVVIGGSAGTDNNTVYGQTLNVNEALTVSDNLTVADGTANINSTVEVLGNLIIDDSAYLNFIATGADYADGGTAIIVGGTTTIAAGTVFDVDNSGVMSGKISFQVVGGDNVDESVWVNLAYVDGNGFDSEGNSHYYDSSNGYYNFYTQSYVSDTVGGAPRFAQGYVNSVFSFNGVLAETLGGASSRELGLAMGNTLNAALMMINNPLDGIFKNNNNLHPQSESRLARSAGDSDNFGLWISPNLSFRSVDGDYSRGYSDFDIESYGLTIGFDGWVNEQLRLGLFAGVNNSELTGDFQEIDGDDFQLGVYGQAFLPEGFRLNGGLAYIWQDFDARRDVIVSGADNASQRISSSFGGNTLVAALELNKTIPLQNNMFLRPGIGYTYMGTELDSYREKSNAANSDLSLAQQVDSTNFDLHLIRVGADIGWTIENASIVGRAYYVGNAGDRQPNTQAHFVNNPNSPAFGVFGAEYDESMANLGLTFKVAASDNSHFAIDYDALLGSNATTHNVNLTFKYEW